MENNTNASLVAIDTLSNGSSKNRIAIEKSLRSKLIRVAYYNAESRDTLLPIIERLAQRSDKSPTPEGARSLFKRYQKRHPDTKKKWNDFYEPKSKTPTKREDSQEEPKGLLKDIWTKFHHIHKDTREKIKTAPTQVHQFIMDAKVRNKVLKKGVEGLKRAPKDLAKRVWHSFTKEVKTTKGATIALGKMMMGNKPSKSELHDLYGVSVYVAGAALAALTGGASVAAEALGHSFAMHVGIKAIREFFDETFLGYEAGLTVLDFLRLASEVPSDEELKQHLANATTAAVIKALDKGVTDEEMTWILKGDIEYPNE